MDSFSETARKLLEPTKVWSRDEVLANGACPVPRSPGAYAWYFRQVPSLVPLQGCKLFHDLALLYVGISPKEPPPSGKPPSRQTINDRIRYHLTGNAKGSTLRLTLGCLLAHTLGLQLRRVGSGNRMTFAAGEAVISEWLGRNAFVVWAVHPEPWVVERELIRQVSLPLNLDHNAHHPFRATLSAIRSAAKAEARRLPIVPHP